MIARSRRLAQDAARAVTINRLLMIFSSGQDVIWADILSGHLINIFSIYHPSGNPQPKERRIAAHKKGAPRGAFNDAD
jgi:hypothetical protein